MPGNLDQVIVEVSQLLTDISHSISDYESKIGYSCRTGCGQCCLKPAVEAQVVEMLPMARHLIEQGIADEIYDSISGDGEGPCALYKADPAGNGLGRCGHYDQRPSVCRLFGFSAVKKKSGPPELAACHWHKKLFPDEVRAAQKDIDEGGAVPIISDYALQINNLSPSSSLGLQMPINKALKIAIEKLMLTGKYLPADAT